MKSKIVNLILAVLFSCGLWVFVVTVEQPESESTYHDIPVIYQNDGEALLKERGLMIVSERPTVTLKLKSTRSNLRNLNESNINIFVNLANITTAKEHKLNYTISYPGNVPSGEVSVVSASLEQISIKVENRVTKKIPVEPVYEGTVKDPANTIVLTEEVVLDHEFIEVTGPESVMESKDDEKKIAKAVVKVNLQDQTQTIAGEYPYTLCNKDGEPVDASLLTTNVEAVNLKLSIFRKKEITLKVEVIDGGGATEETSTITLDTDKISVYGPEALLENLENPLVIGTIDLAEYQEAAQVVFDVVLGEGIVNETGISQVTVDIQFPKLKTRSISVKNIQVINTPEGLTAEVATKEFSVTVRGPEEQVNAMKASDFTVKVDLTGAIPGSYTKGVTVIVDSKYADVGVIKTDSLSVVVTEIVEEETT